MATGIVNFVRGTEFGDLSAGTRFVMKRSLLDTLGVAVVGSRSRISPIVREFAAQHMPAAAQGPAARMLFDGRRVSPMGAAMAGAFTIDSVDAHDGYSAVKGHAGSAVLPGVLAVAEDLLRQGRTFSGRNLITALAIAYEVAYRCGLTLHATVADYHTSGAWTSVGVAAASARLLGLDRDAIRHAMGIAEYHGPRSQMMRCIDHPSMVRDGVGWGAPSGVGAAYMAAMGFTGAPAVTVEGEAAAQFWHDLGDRWEVENTHYKRYPVCRWSHPAIDAVRQLMDSYGLAAEDVRRVRIQTFHNATRLAGHEPKSLDDLAYSLAFPVAAMIVRGRLGVEELQEATLADPAILRVSRATEIVETEHYNRISVRQRWADVTLYLEDGRELQSEPRFPRGDPEDPLSDLEIHEKYTLLAAPVIGATRAEQLAGLVADVEEDSFDLPDLLDLATAPA